MAGKSEDTAELAKSKTKAPKRDIGGNIPYTTSVGVLDRTLKNLIEAERPDILSRDFLSTVLGASGGAAAPIIPILKKVEFLDSAGKPTELYAEFQSASTRSPAALAALKKGFDDIFQRNKYAHKADDEKLKELARQVTGLPKGDPILGYMLNTFKSFQKYISKDETDNLDSPSSTKNIESLDNYNQFEMNGKNTNLGLSYNINIVLPNNASIETYSKIFKSLKENLLG